MASAKTYDIGLGPDGDLPVRTRHVTGLDLVLQRVSRRLRTVRGEWLADQAVGLPFFDWLAQKPPDVAGIGALVRRAIETTPGVARVSAWASSWDVTSRRLTYSATIHMGDGKTATVAVEPLGDGGNRAPHLQLLLG